MTHAVPLTDLVAALAAIDRVLDDDRAHRVTLLKDTWMALSRSSGTLQTFIKSIDVQVPVATNKESHAPH